MFQPASPPVEGGGHGKPVHAATAMRVTHPAAHLRCEKYVGPTRRSLTTTVCTGMPSWRSFRASAEILKHLATFGGRAAEQAGGVRGK